MTADDARGEDYEAARPVPARSGVTGDPWVRGHLPECPVEQGTDHSAKNVSVAWSNGACICPALRACEQRVLDAAWEAVADLTPFVFAYQTWISGDYGYDEGPWVKKENALAAIDALLPEGTRVTVEGGQA